ncbi:hypothetical protein CYMTET_18913 [Cymbomonas tetramitiformis]|uniref:Secreted protein n=1 Tax=Cymbomonas tetramitiformis TaxID=36881 RepID=A0AAE0L5S4_9CHLO|nr:hypothetical protein CYMTET_18913 [Cymbomonas tetramitiformis]
MWIVDFLVEILSAEILIVAAAPLLQSCECSGLSWLTLVATLHTRASGLSAFSQSNLAWSWCEESAREMSSRWSHSLSGASCRSLQHLVANRLVHTGIQSYRCR